MAWGLTVDGKRIPLDLVAPVYELSDDGRASRTTRCYVSHFSTCPLASTFSKKGEKSKEKEANAKV